MNEHRPVDPAAEVAAAAAELGRRLRAAGMMVATVESCTGGLIAAALTEAAGSSQWFDRGFVTYSNDAKVESVGVRRATLERDGAVSETVAQEMAAGALASGAVGLAIAVTGVAGPGGGSEHKPVGTVCFAWADAGGSRHSATLRFAGDRVAVRSQAVLHALREASRFVVPAQRARPPG